jgi:hypothetical protein
MPPKPLLPNPLLPNAEEPVVPKPWAWVIVAAAAKSAKTQAVERDRSMARSWALWEA